MVGRKTPGRFVIQDCASGLYLKHDETDGIDHPYVDVEKMDDATVWTTLEHVSYVLWWYVSVHKEYRIIDLDTNRSYVKDLSFGRRKVRME